ncbi:MAG: glycosyltransferase, partial [Desulfobaccales bacterium]
MLADAPNFDVILMNRDLVPEPGITFIEPWLSKKNPRLIFDFDDAIHLGDREAKLRKILPHFAWVTPGNEYLASFASQCNPHVSVWPTVVDTAYYYPMRERKPGPIRIGWTGSQSTVQYCLPLMKNILIELSCREDFEFIITADIRPNIDWPGVKWRFIPWSPQTEVETLQEFDIGVMPLQDNPFERGKCGMKAILYMAAGIPALVSPVGVNQEIVIHNVTGFHCLNNEEWVYYLTSLIENDNLRRQMGR